MSARTSSTDMVVPLSECDRSQERRRWAEPTLRFVQVVDRHWLDARDTGRGVWDRGHAALFEERVDLAHEGEGLGPGRWVVAADVADQAGRQAEGSELGVDDDARDRADVPVDEA